MGLFTYEQIAQMFTKEDGTYTYRDIAHIFSYVLLLGGSFRAPAFLWGWDVAVRPVHSPVRGLPDSEKRRSGAEILYELETGFREEGWPSEEFIYNAEHDLYRFPDGEFAFSKEYANERRLREMSIIV